MWPSRRSLRGQRNRGRGGEGSELPHFFLLPSLPLPFGDVFCKSPFFRIKMASVVKRSRTVALSAERVLESLEQKGDGNDGMSSGEESDLYRQLQHTRSRYKLFFVTVLLRNHTMRFRSFYCLVLAIQSTTVIERTPSPPLEFINFNRNGICLPREAFSISKTKTLKLYAMNRREET